MWRKVNWQKVKKGKEHIFKLDIQGAISNKQLLISIHRKMLRNIGTGIQSHNLSFVYVQGMGI